MWDLKQSTNKTLSSQNQRTDWWLPEVEGGGGQMGEGGQRYEPPVTEK